VRTLYRLLALSFVLLANLHSTAQSDTYSWSNNIPPRFQWNGNFGYCGEVSLISAGLYYGQYVSQYEARAIASKNAKQNKTGSQLLLGVNDTYAAAQMHLNAVEWNTAAETDTDSFLAWVKQNVVNGYPVAIGIYTNEYLFYGNTKSTAGDPDYDHIVPVTGFSSNHPLTSTSYYSDDILTFSDNGLWGNPSNPPYIFSYPIGSFQATRKEANSKTGAIYSVTNDASNYGIAVTGVMDTDHDTMPVRVATNVNDEVPAIVDGSNTRPAPMSLTLTITVSGLEPGVTYNLYRYNNFTSVPDHQFNANANEAYETWSINIVSGSKYSMTESISSDEIAAYRVVPASAP
jgi:hypothetical protein